MLIGCLCVLTSAGKHKWCIVCTLCASIPTYTQSLSAQKQIHECSWKRPVRTPPSYTHTSEQTHIRISKHTSQMEAAGGDGGAALRLHQVRCVRAFLFSHTSCSSIARTDGLGASIGRPGSSPLQGSRPQRLVISPSPTNLNKHKLSRQVHPEQAAGVQRPRLPHRRQQGMSFSLSLSLCGCICLCMCVWMDGWIDVYVLLVSS